MDPFSPSSPARVRALILPFGRIKRARFFEYLGSVTPCSEISLKNLPTKKVQIPEPFAPSGNGHVLYDFITSPPSEAHMALSPFELFREMMVVLAIVDVGEYFDQRDGHDDGDGAVDEKGMGRLRDLIGSTMERLEEEYPRVLVRKVLLFNSAEEMGGLGNDVISIPADAHVDDLREVMGLVTAALLKEMPTLAASLKALPDIPSPSTTGPTAAYRSSSQPANLSRTNSQGYDGARSSSPGSSHLHRMSMPVLPSQDRSLSGSPRPQSPGTMGSGSQTPPATTFDEMMNGGGGGSSGSTKPTSSSSSSRDPRKDRVSISGFGPGSLDERKRNQGKNRISIAISSLYLLAGRWDDALVDLVDSAAKARSFADHIWHAKCLEYMMAAMVLMAWTGTPFRVPSVCYPVLERTTSKLKEIVSPTSPTGGGGADAAGSRKELGGLLPDLASMILSIYHRAASHGGEYLPQIAYSECVLRLSKTLAALYIGEGTLNQEAMGYLISGTQPQASRSAAGASRSRITEMLMRALPPAESLPAVEECAILAGVASVFSALDMHRKKSVILKDYIQVFIRALDEAKRSGAAEAGVHPSSNGFAQASQLPGAADAGEGLEDFLNMICRVYGIPESKWVKNIGGENGASDGKTDGNGQLIGNFVLRSFGSVNIKSDVLRICIKLCEALPDPHGVLYWASALLRTAGPGTAPSVESSDVLVSLSREEQLILSSTISKTVSDAKAMGLEGIEAEYWDEFLVRGVTLIESSSSLALHSHKKSDLLATEPKTIAKKGPFIHNPFLEKPKIDSTDLLVADDEREFIVSLQNPYDFEVFIESIRFMAGETVFGHAENLTLKPYRTQSFSVTGAVESVGTCELDKCLIKILGCRERAFSIFAKPWKPAYNPKIKTIGLLHKGSTEEQRKSDASMSSLPTRAFPKPTTIPLSVIPAQAVLEVTAVSLPQSSVMLLEGETARFSVTIRNASKTVAADFVHVSFSDSTTAAVQEALSKKNLSSAELYELEHQLSHQSAIKLIGQKPKYIAPGAEVKLEFEVLGKPGLANAAVLIDYANLEQQHTENKNIFYTRQVSIPLSITVNASIQVHRVEILPVAEHIAGQPSEGSPDNCLLLLDLRNAWPVPLEICFEILDQDAKKSLPPSNTNSAMPFLKTRELVQPGHLSRIILLLPRLYISNPHARIRSANERQFVVSAHNMSVESERASRELFWYREALLEKLKATWRQEGTSTGGKSGVIDLRGAVRLTPRMVDALRIDDVEIDMSIKTSDAPKAAEDKDHYALQVDEYAIFRTRITNRSDATIYPLLRLRPSMSHQHSPDTALDLGKRLAFSGLLQRMLPPLPPGGNVEAELGICGLCEGEFEIGATVEEVRPRKLHGDSGGDKSDDRGDGGIPDPVAGLVSQSRRSWVARRVCRIVVEEE